MTDNASSSRLRQMPAQRRLAISDLFADQPAVSIEELADRFGVSRETIRRDLITLEKRGEIQRVHGGGIRKGLSSAESPYEVRVEAHAVEKAAIARKAAELVAEAQTVFLDVGTTVARVVEHLPKSFSGSLITNSLLVAQNPLNNPEVEMTICGGRMRHGDMALSGPTATAMMRDIFVEVALLGAGGVDPDHGLTDFYSDEIDLRRLVIENTKTSIVLADSTKIGKVATYRVVPLSHLSGVIVDDGVDPDYVKALEDDGVTVYIAPTGDE